MQDKVNEVLKRVEFVSTIAERYFENDNMRAYERKINQIDGMLDALSIFTGKKYILTEDNKVKEVG